MSSGPSALRGRAPRRGTKQRRGRCTCTRAALKTTKGRDNHQTYSATRVARLRAAGLPGSLTKSALFPLRHCLRRFEGRFIAPPTLGAAEKVADSTPQETSIRYSAAGAASLPLRRSHTAVDRPSFPKKKRPRLTAAQALRRTSRCRKRGNHRQRVATQVRPPREIL